MQRKGKGEEQYDFAKDPNKSLMEKWKEHIHIKKTMQKGDYKRSLEVRGH